MGLRSIATTTTLVHLHDHQPDVCEYRLLLLLSFETEEFTLDPTNNPDQAASIVAWNHGRPCLPGSLARSPLLAAYPRATKLRPSTAASYPATLKGSDFANVFSVNDRRLACRAREGAPSPDKQSSVDWAPKTRLMAFVIFSGVTFHHRNPAPRCWSRQLNALSLLQSPMRCLDYVISVSVVPEINFRQSGKCH